MHAPILRKVKVQCLTAADIITIDVEHFEKCKFPSTLLMSFSFLEA
jgi:hypothetical protein